jgi:hypothetical protein
MLKKLIVFFVITFFSNDSFSQETNNIYVTKGKGFEFHFFEDKYLLQLDFRGQFRGSYISDKFPNLGDEFDEENTNFGINRARIKIGGHVFKPYYKFYFEQDIRGGNLLDFRVMIEKYSFLKLKVGQWKARYSRERVISSGKQQGLDRSLINSVFTIDRQQGLSLYGNLKGNNALNFNYWASVFAGTGRGGESNDDNSLMYLLRFQWNPNGEVLGFAGSDLENHERLVSSIAIAGVTNTSKYTQFSTNGGGQLPGFEDGIDGQYKVDQLMFETAFKYKGISWQQEFHYKNIDDRVNIDQTTLIGNYFQMGYFFHNVFTFFPESMEIFGRQAFYDPDLDIPENNTYEYTFGCNWFFKGHKNKLTLEYSYFKGYALGQTVFKENRIRLQWDVSIF